MKSRRQLTAVLTVLAMLGMLSTGCGTKSEQTEASHEADTASQIYQIESLTEAQENVELSALEYHDGALYVLQNTNSANGNSSLSSLYCYDKNDNGTKLFDCQFQSDYARAVDFAILSDGSFAFSVEDGSNPNMEPDDTDESFDWEAYWEDYVSTYSVDFFSPDGTPLRSVETTGCGEIAADTKDQILLMITDFDKGMQAQKIAMDGTVTDLPDFGFEYSCGCHTISDGSVVVLCSKSDGSTAVLSWDVDAEEFQDISPSDMTKDSYYQLIASAEENVPYYLQSDQALYAVSADGSLSKAVDLTGSGMTGSGRSPYFVVGESGVFYAIFWNENNCSYLGKLGKKTDTNTTKTLTLGTYYADSNLSDAISKFNRSQSKYRIQIKDYSQYDTAIDNGESDQKGLTVLNEDIAAGNMPDLMNVTGIDFISYAKKGAFRNLYDFMATDDTYPKEALLPNLLQACEINEELYWLAPEFGVRTLIANQELTEGKTAWSMQEFVDICRKCDSEGISLMPSQIQEIYLDTLAVGDQWVDMENNICHFDDPAFLDALHFSQEMKEEQPPDYENVTPEEWDAYYTEDTMKYVNGKRLFSDSYITRYEGYLMEAALFPKSQSTLIGYPTLDGSKGSYFNFNSCMYAISANCSDPEGAWEFIRQTLEVDIAMSAFPVLTEKLKEALQRPLEKYDELGLGHVNMNHVELTVDKPTQEDMEAFFNYLQSIDQIETGQIAYKTYHDVMEDFYSGTRTAEETAAQMQERFQLYLKENQ